MAPRSAPRPFLLQEREFTMQEGIVRRQAQLIGGEEGGGGGGGGGRGGEGEVQEIVTWGLQLPGDSDYS